MASEIEVESGLCVSGYSLTENYGNNGTGNCYLVLLGYVVRPISAIAAVHDMDITACFAAHEQSYGLLSVDDGVLRQSLMAPHTTTTSGSVKPPRSPPPASSPEPLSVRSSIERRRHHVKTRTQRQKASRAVDNTRRPAQAPISNKPSKGPIWSPVPPVDENDTIPMEVCVEEDWNGVPEFYILDSEKVASPDIWLKAKNLDQQQEDRDFDNIILDLLDIDVEAISNDETPNDGSCHGRSQNHGTA
ncbi:hypothetical protein BZA77DRAFT_292284 [Pyronema omphalodes]|nr:hypothetical protein BZA77DRAFT_292284 [Pyronema omphalodes]